ncbi:MAG: metallophosphatase family protein [Myxococcaceae bacterium]|nr:MAG: metallophosphatase family protein [Myxococcaceae bacterium]
MKLYAISDLHLRHTENHQALAALAPRPDDWLIVGGDVGETLADMDLMLRTLTARFRQVVWVPGNHELWSMPSEQPPLRGEARYLRMVDLCHRYGALTPEDPYPRWPGDGPHRHYPLRYEHVRLPRIPRFSIWCGTRLTEDWHTRYRAEVVVTGHLHMPATLWRDGVRFEEVSLGYPQQWRHRGGLERCLREVLPGPEKSA